MWNCRCKCGNAAIVSTDNLRSGQVKSCGCLGREVNLKAVTRHGMSSDGNGKFTRPYSIWCGMRQRCYYRKHVRWGCYGGRGIAVCDDWMKFESFWKWAECNGYQDDLTLDRIDNDGNYEPSNCRWVTAKEQNNNSRNCRFIEFRGQIKTLRQWADDLGIGRSRLSYRINNGWTVEEALLLPPYVRRRDAIKRGHLRVLRVEEVRP